MPTRPKLAVFFVDALMEEGATVFAPAFRSGTAHFLSAVAQDTHIAIVGDAWDTDIARCLVRLDPAFKELGAPNLRGTFVVVGNVRPHSVVDAVREAMLTYHVRNWNEVLVVGTAYMDGVLAARNRGCRVAVMAHDGLSLEDRRAIDLVREARLVHDVDDIYGILATEY